MIEKIASPQALRHMLENYDSLKEDKRELGLALHRQFDKALALSNGLAGHSGAVLGEAYRREGVFKLSKLSG
jgi:hypothetical protein